MVLDRRAIAVATLMHRSCRCCERLAGRTLDDTVPSTFPDTACPFNFVADMMSQQDYAFFCAFVPKCGLNAVQMFIFLANAFFLGVSTSSRISALPRFQDSHDAGFMASTTSTLR